MSVQLGHLPIITSTILCLFLFCLITTTRIKLEPRPNYVAFLAIALNIKRFPLGIPFHDVYVFPVKSCFQKLRFRLCPPSKYHSSIPIFLTDPFVKLFSSDSKKELAYAPNIALEPNSVSVVDLADTPRPSHNSFEGIVPPSNPPSHSAGVRHLLLHYKILIIFLLLSLYVRLVPMRG